MDVAERLAVVETKLDSFSGQVEDHFETVVAELQTIKVETKKTNGRVNVLELKHAEQRGMVAAFRIMALIPTIAVSILTIVLGLQVF